MADPIDQSLSAYIENILDKAAELNGENQANMNISELATLLRYHNHDGYNSEFVQASGIYLLTDLEYRFNAHINSHLQLGLS